MKRQLFFALACCLGLTVMAAGGSVTTVEEAHAPADTIYVSGAPDLYPIEYYDSEAEAYLGILPECLEQVAEETGLSFAYLRGGQGDQRKRMAENKQVEIVSGLTAEEAADLGLTLSSFTLHSEGETYSFAFTALADPALISAVDGALSAITPEDIVSFTISAARERTSLPYPVWLPLIGFGLALLFLVLTIRFARRGRRNKEEEQRMLRTDPVTGIGNWKYFTHYFEQVSPQARPVYAVAYFGFDGPRVQDTGGEELLERTLVFAAKELTRTAADTDIIARIGNGFLAAHACVGQERVAQWAQSMLRLINAADTDNNPATRFRCGIYTLSTDDRDAETVLFNSRQAYLRACRENEEYLFSSKAMLKSALERRELLTQFQSALERRELKLYLQFVIDVASERIVGSECLSRWDHPTRGLLHPGSFIDLLTESGDIPLLDYYMFDSACRQLESWEKQGIRLYLSCNFNLLTLEDPHLPERLREIMDRYDFDHSRLIAEMTEDTREVRTDITHRNLQFLRDLGIVIALDDVGSGYSSFTDLRDYPAEIFKIDRSILLNAESSEQGLRLMRGMAALAHSLQMDVLCEGVETRAQFELVRQAGCDRVQGFLFYRPMPAEEATRLLIAKR